MKGGEGKYQSLLLDEGTAASCWDMLEIEQKVKLLFGYLSPHIISSLHLSEPSPTLVAQ